MYPKVREALIAETVVLAVTHPRLVTTEGKISITDLQLHVLVHDLLHRNGSALPSIGNSMYACFILLSSFIGQRAVEESASFMARHFTKGFLYGWPGYFFQFDLPRKNNKVDSKMKIKKTIRRFLVDVDLIALLEYFLNPVFNPNCEKALFNIPLHYDGSRTRAGPHFSDRAVKPSTIGNWVKSRISLCIKNYPTTSATKRFTITQVFGVTPR